MYLMCGLTWLKKKLEKEKFNKCLTNVFKFLYVKKIIEK